MTREEVKRYIGELKMYAKSQGWDEEYQIACDVAMNELEQEPVIDKIRAEIEELKPNNPNFKGYFEQNVALNKVLEILDKYKVESEE